MMARATPSAVRQALAVSAVALALVAQQLVHRQEPIIAGWLLFAVAAALAAVVTWSRPLTRANAVVPAAQSSVHLRRAFWVAGATLAVIATTYLSSTDRWPVAAILLWAVGLLCASLAVRRWTVTPPAREPVPWRRGEVAAVAAIVTVAAIARVAWLSTLPRYFFDDEARVGLYLLSHFGHGKTDLNFFVMGWNTWPVIGMALQGVFAPLFGLSTPILRLSSALVGTLAIILTYLLARELFTARIALLTAFLFAICRTALLFSRLGVCHAQVLLFESFTFFCWWRAVNRGAALSYLWAGIGLGLCLYTYNAGQLVPLLWLGWLALGTLFARSMVRTHWRAVLITVAGFVLTQFTYIFYFTDHFRFGPNWAQWTCMARSRQALSEALDAWRAAGLDAAAAVIWRQVSRTWLGFNVLPMGSYHLGYRGGGMLDDVTGALFVLGLAICLARVTRPREAFVFYWWLATAIVGGVLTIEAPAFVRMVAILPVLALLGAMTLDQCLRLYWGTKLGARLGMAVVGLLLAGASWDNWKTYFVEFAKEPVDDTSELMRHVQTQPASTPAVLLGMEEFLNFHHEMAGTDFRDRQLLEVAEPEQFLPVHQPLGTPMTLFLGPTEVTLSSYVQALYPHTQVTDVKRWDQLLFRMLRLEAADVVARTGLQLTAYDDNGAIVSRRTGDPFAPDPEVGSEGQRLQWEGSIYWPTDRAITLQVTASRTTDVHVGNIVLHASGGGEATQTTVALPRGWQLVLIQEQPGKPRTLSMSLSSNGSIQPITRWNLNPSSTRQGLAALYERDGEPLLKAIDPQLNSFADESQLRQSNDVNDVQVRAPFAVSWTGALRVRRPGAYGFEVSASGPYSIRLGNQLLLQSAEPEQPNGVARAARELAEGLHPLTAHWDQIKPYPTRRWFQVYWTPPGGSRELIPPSSFVPADSSAVSP